MSIIDDWAAKKLPGKGGDIHREGGGALKELLKERGVQVVDLKGWRRIDEVERRAGEARGRPRVKITNLAAMLEAAAV